MELRVSRYMRSLRMGHGNGHSDFGPRWEDHVIVFATRLAVIGWILIWWSGLQSCILCFFVFLSISVEMEGREIYGVGGWELFALFFWDSSLITKEGRNFGMTTMSISYLLLFE